jgi:colicin import membrane protein
MTFHRVTRDYDNGLNKMIYVSLLLHAFVLVIIFSLPLLPSPRWTFGPVYTVSLVSSSMEFQSKKTTSAIAQEIKGTISGDRLLRKHTDAFVPIRRIDRPQKQISSVDKAIEDIRKRTASSTSTSRQVDESESSAEINAYYALIWSRIKGQWALPQGILPRENIEAIIQARILKNGAIANVSFEKRSGNRYFDESAMKAIKKASPFPHFPSWMSDNSIEVGIRFRSAELR